VGKHAGYCAAIRLGFDVPATWLLPHKVPPENERFAPTASRYNRAFDLAAVGERVGYPAYMKPFHGGSRQCQTALAVHTVHWDPGRPAPPLSWPELATTGRSGSR
jgi:hypothetical protein